VGGKALLSIEENEYLCRIGPGTPMGNLLRRYWMPAALSRDIPTPDSPPIRVRILGEDLVAFRDTNGRVGLLDNYCPHRRASLFFGRVEEGGLRCVYHGWKYDVEGNCVDMPSEPVESNFKDKVRITSYPTQEAGGTVWAYFGPREEIPPFLNFPIFSLPQEEVASNRVQSYCNYIQAIEGNIDTSHISFLHRNLADFEMQDFDDGTDKPGFPSDKMSTKIRGFSRGPKVEVQDTEYGYRYVGIRATPNGHLHLRITCNIFPIYQMVSRLPNSKTQGPGLAVFVPIDDENCWRWNISGRPGRPYSAEEREEMLRTAPRELDEQGRPLRGHWNDYLIDREAQVTTSYTGISGVGTQDRAVTESMGSIADRSQEHLGTTDAAIIRLRRMLIKAAQSMQEGEDPPTLDPETSSKIRSHEEIIPAGADWRLYGAYAGEASGIPVS